MPGSPMLLQPELAWFFCFWVSPTLYAKPGTIRNRWERWNEFIRLDLYVNFMADNNRHDLLLFLPRIN